jgi:putative ABC transport system ATP-binding protein
MAAPAPIRLAAVSHAFGSGALRQPVLEDVSVEIRAGEIVIVTGPSGSGKTTLLTLIGALRSAQAGSVRVLDAELRGARSRALAAVRRQIGYVFQAHNLLDALTAEQNVQMAAQLDRALAAREARARAAAMLEAVGLGAQRARHPSDLSGGQRQRVAIARALVGQPRIVLADEPTASLDRRSGREVVDLMHDLAKRRGVSVLLVTHDHRILDIADRIVHLEDGRLRSFTEAVTANTRHMLGLLARSNRQGELHRQVAELPEPEFAGLLEQVTQEAQDFLRVTALGRDDAFQSMLEEALAAFTFRFGRLVDAERASLFLVDRERGELWLKVAQEEGGRPVDVRFPLERGIAGEVTRTGRSLRVDDAYVHPLFHPEVDRVTGFRTRSILCVPIQDRAGRVFAVAQLLNKGGGAPFSEADEERFVQFTRSIGVVLESWFQMSQGR